MYSKYFLSIVLFMCAFNGNGQCNQNWEIIKSYFIPPDSLKADFADYPSPLLFSNGDLVTTPEQWKIRRNEILKQWEKCLGRWPDLFYNQKLIFMDTTVKNGYRQYSVKFKWTPTQWTTGYLLVPEYEGVKPAIVTVFYEPETAIGAGKPKRDFALQLVKKGFVTLSIGTKEASAKNEFSLFYPSIDSVSVQPLSMLAYAANNAYFALSNLPEIDRKRIGIIGHSFGGKWAMFASCLTENFAAAVWSDPGIMFDEGRPSVNYWEPWYLGFHPKPWRKRGLITPANPSYGTYNQLRADHRNLHELHVLMAPRPFLVSGGSEDPISRWRALNHSIAVNKILGYENRVAMTNRLTHEPTDTTNEIICHFFEYFLKPSCESKI